MAFNTQIFRNLPPVTKNLLLINIFIFILLAIAPAQKQALAEHYLALHYWDSPYFNPAQLFTYMFIHGGFTHLFFNMFTLFMFGPAIEYSLGSRRFIFYYISCGIGAALVQMGVFTLVVNHLSAGLTSEQMHMIIDRGLNVAPQAQEIYNIFYTPTVGASGAIYGVLLAFAMFFPNMQMYLLIPPMPVKAKWMVLGFAAIELLLGISGRQASVAHFCHLGGMLVGLLIILYWRHKGTVDGQR